MTTLIDTATSQSLLQTPVFTANLRANAPGTYTFGAINASEYNGDVAYTPVSSANGLWEFNATGYAVGGGAVVEGDIDAIADTGTTLIYLPAYVVEDYYKGVVGAGLSSQYGGWVLDCGAGAPDLTVRVGGYDAVVPGRYIEFVPVEQGSSSKFFSSGFSFFLACVFPGVRLTRCCTSVFWGRAGQRWDSFCDSGGRFFEESVCRV